MRTFLSKIDNWLAVRYPILWATQAHKVFIYASIYVLLGSFALFVSQWSIPNVFNIHAWWKFLYIPIVLLGIYWIWMTAQFKVENRFGLVGKREEWARLLAVTGAIASLALAPMLIRDACYARLRMMIPREEFFADLDEFGRVYQGFDISYECYIEEFHERKSKSEANEADLEDSPSVEEIKKKKIEVTLKLQTLSSKYTDEPFVDQPVHVYEDRVMPFAYAHSSKDSILPFHSDTFLILNFIILGVLNIFLPLLFTDFRTVVYVILVYFVGSVMMGLMRYERIGMEGNDNVVLPLTFCALFLYFSMLLIGGRAKMSRSLRFHSVVLLIPSIFTPMMLLICIMVFNSDLYLSIFMMQIPLFYSLIFFFGINALVWIYWTAPRLRRLYASPNAS